MAIGPCRELRGARGELEIGRCAKFCHSGNESGWVDQLVRGHLAVILPLRWWWSWDLNPELSVSRISALGGSGKQTHTHKLGARMGHFGNRKGT